MMCVWPIYRGIRCRLLRVRRGGHQDDVRSVGYVAEKLTGAFVAYTTRPELLAKQHLRLSSVLTFNDLRCEIAKLLSYVRVSAGQVGG